MKRAISSLITAVLFIIALSAAHGADYGGFGVGIIIGAPTGLSVKGWVGPHQAFDGAASWTTSGHDESLYLHADMLFQRPNAVHLDPSLHLDWHYGLGMVMRFKNETELGLRIPIGIDYSLTEIPLEFFAEIVPVVLLAPDTDFNIDGGIGVRIFF